MVIVIVRGGQRRGLEAWSLADDPGHNEDWMGTEVNSGSVEYILESEMPTNQSIISKLCPYK